MIRQVVLLLSALLLADRATAQPLDVEALASQPGTTVTKRTENGVAVTELSRAGVVMIVRPDGVLTLDKTGKAVGCLWEIAVALWINADVCHPGTFPQLSKMLGDYVEAANAFIVANSPRPVSPVQLDQAIAQRREKAVCSGQADADEMLLRMNADLEMSRREFMDSLKVPRWPAANPCL